MLGNVAPFTTDSAFLPWVLGIAQIWGTVSVGSSGLGIFADPWVPCLMLQCVGVGWGGAGVGWGQSSSFSEYVSFHGKTDNIISAFQ